MAGILRESCLEIIDKTYEAINSSLDGKNVDSNIWLKDLSARMERINRLRKKKDYLETIKCLDRDGLQVYFNLVGRMARELRLPIYRCFVDMEIAEEQELLTLYANGVVHERGKSIEIDQGMRIRFRLESKNQDAKQRVEVEWDKKRKGKGEQEGFYEALNDIKNMVDTDSLDREFAFEQVGEYKVSAAVYKYMKKSLIKKIKTLAQAYECTVIVNEGEELYEGMEFKDKLWEALSAVDWKGVVQDSMFDVTSQLPIMVGTIVLLSGVLIAISMSPIGWLAPLVGTAMQVFGLSGAVEDVARGIYMFTDAILRIRDAKSKAGMSQATRHLEESFRQVAPSLMLDVLLFLGGKRVARNPTGSDLVQSTPKTKIKPQVEPEGWDEILDTLNKKPDITSIEEMEVGLEIYSKNWQNLDRVLTVSERINQYDGVKNIVTSGAGGGTASQRLRENLKRAGIEPPPYPNAVHHIVAVGSEKARASVAILQAYGIDLDSPANGVFLPYRKNEFVTTEAMHCGGHLNEYHDQVWGRLLNRVDFGESFGYTDSQIQQLLCAELQKIRSDLLTGKLKIHN